MKTASTIRRGGLLVAATTALLPGHPVWADHGSGELPNRDNNDQEFDSHSLQPQSQLACSHGKTQLGDSTEITVSVGDGDVHCYDENQGPGLGGYTKCAAKNYTGNRCDHYEIHFNTSYQSVIPLSDAKWKSIGRHEVGHTSNINHRSAANDGVEYSCMRDGDALADANYPTGYDWHDENEINGDY